MSLLHLPTAAQCTSPAIMYLNNACYPFGSLDKSIAPLWELMCDFWTESLYGRMLFSLCARAHLHNWKPSSFFLQFRLSLTFWFPESLSALSVIVLWHWKQRYFLLYFQHLLHVAGAIIDMKIATTDLESCTDGVRQCWSSLVVIKYCSEVDARWII